MNEGVRMKEKSIKILNCILAFLFNLCHFKEFPISSLKFSNLGLCLCIWFAGFYLIMPIFEVFMFLYFVSVFSLPGLYLPMGLVMSLALCLKVSLKII